ncbi:MAG: PilZ domain-containing protein [Roseiarcus sp.]
MPDAASSPALDRRQTQRSRCFRAALCVFNNGQSDLEVTLRNLSDAGAKITGDELAFLPDNFELRIRDPFGRYEKRQARRVWSRGGGAGLGFENRGA